MGRTPPRTGTAPPWQTCPAGSSSAGGETLHTLASLRLQFEITTSDGDLSADLALDRDVACAGTLGYVGTGSFEIIKTGDEVWLKPDQDFWESQVPPDGAEAASALLGDKYLTGPPGHEMIASLAEVCDLDEFLDEQAELADPDVKYSKGETTTVDGREVVAVHWTHGTAESTLYVDTSGEFHPRSTGQGGCRRRRRDELLRVRRACRGDSSPRGRRLRRLRLR